MESPKRQQQRTLSANTRQLQLDNVEARMRKFAAMSKFARAARNMIARMVPDAKLEEVRRLFVRLDRDNDGMIGYHELKGVLELKSDTFGEIVENFEEICRKIDVSKSGGINYTEFLALMLDDRVAQRRSVCRQAFNVFSDDRGEIDAQSLAKALGGEMNQDACYYALREAGYDGSAVLSFEDFCAVVNGGGKAVAPRRLSAMVPASKLGVDTPRSKTHDRLELAALSDDWLEIRRSCFL